MKKNIRRMRKLGGNIQLFIVMRYEVRDMQKTEKNFNKALCFSNIRELLYQKTDIGIGQIEKAAGLRLGYMARLEKEGNTAAPSMEFVVTAAKLLGVSVDMLISIDLIKLTPTERYLAKFLDKLKKKTLKGEVEWCRRTDDFVLGLEDETTFYIVGDDEAKELWANTAMGFKQLLISNKDNTPIVPFLNALFLTIKEQIKRPRLNKDIIQAIDLFMK